MHLFIKGKGLMKQQLNSLEEGRYVMFTGIVFDFLSCDCYIYMQSHTIKFENVGRYRMEDCIKPC